MRGPLLSIDVDADGKLVLTIDTDEDVSTHAQRCADCKTYLGHAAAAIKASVQRHHDFNLPPQVRAAEAVERAAERGEAP